MVRSTLQGDSGRGQAPYNRRMRKLIQRTAIVWLALLGVLFGTLAPAVAHALVPRHAVSIEMQVCSSAGMPALTVTLDDGSAPAGAMGPFEHCPCCGQHAQFPVLLGAQAAAILAPASAAGYPPRFYQSATPLFAWSASSPRAPPARA